MSSMMVRMLRRCGVFFALLGLALCASAAGVRLLPGDAAIGPAIGTQTAPAVAEGNGSSLAVWQDLRTSPFVGPPFASEGRGFDIYVQRLDAQGDPLDPSPILIGHRFGDQTAPRVAWNGQSWLVAWAGPNSTLFNQRIEAVRIDSTGQILDESPIMVQNSMSPAKFELVSNGSEWLVVAHASSSGENNFRGTRISEFGEVLNPGGTELIPATGSLYSFRLASALGEYLLVWGNSATAPRGQRFSAALAPVGDPFPVGSLNIASSGSAYFVADVGQDAGFNTIIFGQRLSATGVPGPLLTLAGGSGSLPLVNPFQLAVGWDGGNWWVSWLETTRNVVFSRAVSDETNGDFVVDFGGLAVDSGAPEKSAFAHALAGLGGGAQFAWADGRAAGALSLDLVGSFVASDGTSSSPIALATSARAQLGLDFASGSDALGNPQLLAVFASDLSGDRRILAQRLDADGNPLDAEPFELSAGAALGFPHVGFDGSRYMVVWSDGGQVMARRVSPDGTVVDPAPLAMMDGSSPDVAGQAGRFLVVATRQVLSPQFYHPFSLRVDGASGLPLDPAPVILGQYFARNPRVIALGGRWLAAWQRNFTHDDINSNAHAAFIEADGTSPGEFVIDFSGATPSLAAASDRVLFVWREFSPNSVHNDVLGRLMALDGSFLTAPFGVAAAANPVREFDPDVAWDGSEFVAAWTDTRSSVIYFDTRSEVFGARVLPDGSVLDPAGFALGDRSEQEIRAAVASVAGRTVVGASSFRDEPAFQAYRIAYQSFGDGLAGNRWPVAVASADPASGDVPLATNFSAAGSVDPDGSIASYAWDFGDGGSAAGASAAHTYTLPGEYLAQLTVTDTLGASTSNTVRVIARAPNQPPVAVASATPTSGRAPLSVVFQASGSYDPDDGIAQIQWNFGDGATSFGSQAFHTYSSPGSFFATLTVTDQSGAAAQDLLVIEVGAPNQPPLAVASATPQAGVSPLEVSFSPTGSSDPDGLITGYRWAFGDGVISTEPSPTHVYQTGGQFQAVLTVTDNEGASGTATVTIDVAQGDLSSFANADLATDAGTIVAGSFRDTQVADGVSEALAEEVTGGNPSKRRSQLSHTWTLNVAPGQSYAFHVRAYHSANAEGDDFAFEYSRDGVSFAPMVVVSATAPGAPLQSFAFPGDVSGTLYVRVTDTDRSQGNSAVDTLFVDEMFVVTSFATGGDVTPPAAPTGLFANPGDGRVSLAWNGNVEADLAGYRVYRGGTSGGPYAALNPALLTANGFIDLAVSNGTTYYYVVTALDTSGNESVASNEASATPQAAGGTATMHVASVVVGTVNAARGTKRGQATVTVVDGLGNPVSGALVTGSFSGGLVETVSANTGSNGVAVLTTGSSAKAPSFTFCVDNLTKSGLSYDSSANGASCGSL